MAYRVDLFYGDIGFTSDYSNVLDFSMFETDDEQTAYFDALPHVVINNTDYNAISVNDSFIKIAFNSVSDIVLIPNFSYCRIITELNAITGEVQHPRYAFITNFEIISSAENLTVVRFDIEYDIWQNYHALIKLRECNVERSHVDRWEDNGDIKYKRPCLDAIESNNIVLRKNEYFAKEYKVWNKNGNEENVRVAWVIVSAVHTYGNEPDQLIFHILPIKISNLVFTVSDPSNWEYYIQNSIVFDPIAGNIESYYPSMQMLDNSMLNKMLNFTPQSGTPVDNVKIVNIQFLINAPFVIENGYIATTGAKRNFVKYLKSDGTKVDLIQRTQLISGTWTQRTKYVANSYVTDLALFSDSKKENVVISIEYPEKPTDNADYNVKYEPMLYRQPVISRIIGTCDNNAMCVIPDLILFDRHSIGINLEVSFSATAMYNYITLYNYDRSECNLLGFALNIPSYSYDFLSDAWYDYCVTQRDSDRMMMFANIITGGISETGSTAVSAGIGYRSNIERAIMFENKANTLVQVNNIQRGNQIVASKQGAISDAWTRNALQASSMYSGMARQAMAMSGIGGIAAGSANTLANIMAQKAKETAVRNTPKGLASPGNVIGAINNKQFGIYLAELKADESSYEQYKNIFMKFGYAIGSVIKPDIYSRKYFNYIKTNGAIVTGSLNQTILAKIATIFDNGVTIWHMDYTTKNTLYTYTKENIERSLMQ